MKRILIIMMSLFVITGCGKEKEKLEVKNSELSAPLVKAARSISNDEMTSEIPTSKVVTTTSVDVPIEPTTELEITSSSTTTTHKTTKITTSKTTTTKVITTKKVTTSIVTTKKTTTTPTKSTTTTKKTTTKKITTTKPKVTTPVDLTEEKAYKILLGLKSEYPEGTTWNDNTWSDFHGGNYSGGWGCVGFTYMASDRVFGNLPVKRITDFSKIRVGDIFRYQTGSYGHSVIVLEVKSDRIIVGEGNWQKKVHWNREITFDYMKKHGVYIYTRWPK